jgi:hypothetical protein
MFSSELSPFSLKAGPAHHGSTERTENSLVTHEKDDDPVCYPPSLRSTGEDVWHSSNMLPIDSVISPSVQP